MSLQFSVDTIARLDEVTLLNRAVYGGDNAFRQMFLNDYDPARDPDKVDSRAKLGVYDRYDLYLAEFGFTTLSSTDLGFAADEVSASETTAGLDHNFTYAGGLFRNNYVSNGVDEAPYTSAGAVALTTLKPNETGNTLYLTFRGTDADGPLADGEAGTSAGLKRYYGQLRELIDQVYAYASDPAHDVTEVVVSGHSLGGAIADIFALYDGKRFSEIDGVKLAVVALASSGIDPDLFEAMPGHDEDMVSVGKNGMVRLETPDWYFQYNQADDIVRNPDQYDRERHAIEDRQQAFVTGIAVGALRDHLHFNANRLTFETPLLDQYAVSKNLNTYFLVDHYADFYELIGTEFSKAWPLVSEMEFDKFIALFGKSDAVKATPGDNNVNGWGESVDNKISYAGTHFDLFVLGFSGRDKIRTGFGDDFISGGAGHDKIRGRGGDDVLLGDIDDRVGKDRLIGGLGDDLLFADKGRDHLFGNEGADTFHILAGNGHDWIGDFSGAGGDGDRIDLTDVDGVDDWALLEARMVEGPRNLTIAFDDGSSLVLQGVRKADLVEADFLF